MLECNTSCIANWYFGSDYMVRKLFRLYSGKKMRIVQYLDYSNCVSLSSWDQGQIGIKLRTKHVIYEKFASFT